MLHNPYWPSRWHPSCLNLLDDKITSSCEGLTFNQTNFILRPSFPSRKVWQEKFFEYYLTDPKSGHLYITDYGLTPIMTQASKLYIEDNPIQKVVLIDSILNIAHQRSDLASWFIQGGSRALSDLRGYEIPDEEAGGYDTKSAISGRYKMSDYH